MRGRLALAILSVSSLFQIAGTVWLLVERDYSWLIRDGLRRETAGDLSPALVRLNYAARLCRGFDTVAARRVYNAKLIARALFSAYSQRKDKLDVGAVELLCRADFLDRRYDEEVSKILSVQHELDAAYAAAIRHLRSGHRITYLQDLSGIHGRFVDYGYSGSIVESSRGTEKRQSPSELVLLSHENLKDLETRFMRADEQEVPAIVKELTGEFSVSKICSAVHEMRITPEE
ncbi:MAG TPA: hypothetical protein VEW48_08770 [Thermoanaerobaculia bacterium]|nr:hypothetical protein [Thermoanaerobaculia bacterium]